MGDQSILTKKFHLYLLGPFLLETAEGEDLTPKAQKSRALLSMLAVSPRGSRSRAWLRDKLWSDRYEHRAAASLRQALLDIRKTLGPYADSLLLTDKHTIGLDLRNIRVDALECPPDMDKAEKKRLCAEHFLEGMDIRDPEFEEWLTVERQVWQERLDARAAAPETTTLLRASGLDAGVTREHPETPGKNLHGRAGAKIKPVSDDACSSREEPSPDPAFHEEWVLSLSIHTTVGALPLDMAALDLVRSLEGATLTIRRRRTGEAK